MTKIYNKIIRYIPLTLFLLVLSANGAEGEVLSADTLQPLRVVKEYPQTPLLIERGQYSGITWIADDARSSSNFYAAIHDKLTGGGIVLFHIPLNRVDGTVGSVSSYIAEGTKESTQKSTDSEGIAYIPERNTLLVASERDMSIVEYDINGRTTGQSVEMPSFFAKSNLSNANAGFESLSYNSKSGLLWTTTELPLLQDSVQSRKHRLQSFSGETLTPHSCYLYQTDEPTLTAVAKGDKYAFGISDIAALDDGRLIIMEREAYVPKISNPNDIFELLGAAGKMFATIKLYVVNPDADTSDILNKELLLSFTTTGIYIANYEGICVGPMLADGSRYLILIADSQAHQYTTEWIKLITIR